MVSPEIIQSSIDLIAGFRDYYDTQEAHESYRQELVAHHDESLYFTNSTTSVMKPYLQGMPIPKNGAYLTQPAMGTQGIEAWRRNRQLGPYASYWTSLGHIATGCHDNGVRAAIDAREILTSIWQFDVSKLVYSVHESDTDIQNAFYDAAIPINIDNADESPYRHRYGIAGVRGRNANIFVLNSDDKRQEVGNITLIEDPDHAIAWEVSFDSSPVIAALRDLDHPINALVPSRLVIKSSHSTPDLLVATDCAAVSSALLLEGLEPRSRGKSGVLRKFLGEYASILLNDNWQLAEMNDALVESGRRELTLRLGMSPPEKTTAKLSNLIDVVGLWLPKLVDLQKLHLK